MCTCVYMYVHSFHLFHLTSYLSMRPSIHAPIYLAIKFHVCIGHAAIQCSCTAGGIVDRL